MDASAAHRTFGPDREGPGRARSPLRVAPGRCDRSTGREHRLPALSPCPGAVADVLVNHGATDGTVERALYGEGGRVQGRAGGPGHLPRPHCHR